MTVYWTRLALVLIVAFPFATHAQVTEIDPFGGLDPLTVRLEPEYPQPNSTFLIVPESSLLDLSNARITVTVNGSVVAETTGESPIPVTAPAPGEPLLISVRADINGEAYEIQIPLYLQEVTLIAEPEALVPPFYRGAALTPPRAAVRVIAVPNFRTPTGRIPDSSLSYQWSTGQRELPEFSGIGRSVLEIAAPQLYRDAPVSVIITTQDNQYAAYGQVTLAPQQPVVRVYRKDPLLGILSVPAIGSAFAMNGEEQSFFAAPYHFQRQPQLTWRTGNTTYEGDTLTVRSAGNGESTAQLALTAKVTEQDIFSIADFSTLISFGKTSPASSLFGL